MVEVDVVVKKEQIKTEVEEVEERLEVNNKIVEVKQTVNVKEEVEDDVVNDLNDDKKVKLIALEVKQELAENESFQGLVKHDSIVTTLEYDEQEWEDDFSDEEQVDARQLYPRKGGLEDREEAKDQEEQEELKEEFNEKVVKSIEIMEVSCFNNLQAERGERKEDNVQSDVLRCSTCRRFFTSRKALAR